MRLSWEEIKRLTEANAPHLKKGWRLGDITTETELKDAAGEIVELAHSPDDIDELADVLGCLIGYAVKKGWSCSDVETALMRKLSQRFGGSNEHRRPENVGGTEPCCECGDDYPRADLMAGEIYCPACRAKERVRRRTT
jgi:hypothetical protein